MALRFVHVGAHGWLRSALIDIRAHKKFSSQLQTTSKTINKAFICAMLGPFAHVANYLSTKAADFT
jgi:hypothetical protein